MYILSLVSGVFQEYHMVQLIRMHREYDIKQDPLYMHAFIFIFPQGIIYGIQNLPKRYYMYIHIDMFIYVCVTEMLLCHIHVHVYSMCSNSYCGESVLFMPCCTIQSPYCYITFMLFQ